MFIHAYKQCNPWMHVLSIVTRVHSKVVTTVVIVKLVNLQVDRQVIIFSLHNACNAYLLNRKIQFCILAQ